MLVDFQSESVTGAMEKSDAASFPHFRWKSATGEEFLDRFVNCHSVNAGSDSFKGQRLPSFDGFPKFALRVARASAQDRACHIAEISGLRVAREDIENDQRVCVQRAVAALVRVAGLIAS